MISNAPLFKPLKNEKKIFQQISDEVRESIFSGVLKPGDKLPSENELSIQFKRGRMVVREALRTLEHSGLIYIKRGSYGGAFVKEPDATVITRSIEDLVKIGNVTQRELTEARLGIELVVLESAVKRRTDDDLVLIEKNIEECERIIRSGGQGIEENLKFHILLARSSKNSLYEMIVESIMNVTASFIRSFKPELRYVNKILQSHKEIYDAVREQDGNKAKEKMEKHVRDVNSKHMAIAKKIGLGTL
jgi:DNA-binding FadR family transcriptional regulator